MTAKDLASVLARLRVVAPQLNKATDEATRTVRAVREFLKGLGLGVEASVFVDEEDSTKIQPSPEDPDEETEVPVRISTWLSYKRHGSHGFDIVIEDHTWTLVEDRYGDLACTKLVESTAVLWDQAPRGRKLGTLRVVPKLLSAIAEAAEKHVVATDQTVSAVQEILEALEKSAAPPATRGSGIPGVDMDAYLGALPMDEIQPAMFSTGDPDEDADEPGFGTLRGRKNALRGRTNPLGGKPQAK